MALRKKGKYRYGDDATDLEQEMRRYSRANGYAIEVVFTPVCPCQRRKRPKKAPAGMEAAGPFLIEYSDDEGAAILHCSRCDRALPVADSADYAENLDSTSGCYCDQDEEYGEVIVGAALFKGSEDLRWLYLGWRAPACGLVGVYVDWKVDGSVTWKEVVDGWGRRPER